MVVAFASRHVFGEQLQAEVSRLQGMVFSWLTAGLISSGLAGVGVLTFGLILGAAHRSAYVFGGLLAIFCLLLFGALQEAKSIVCLLLKLLQLDEKVSREDILYRLKALREKVQKGNAVMNLDADFDDAMRQAMKGLPSKLRSILARALQLAPAAAALASASCTVFIFLSDIPDPVSSLPLAIASLCFSAMICGYAIQLRAAAMLRKIAEDEITVKSQSSSFNTTLLELHMNMLRRKLASTPQGQSIARERLDAAVKAVSGIAAAVEIGWLSGLPYEELQSYALAYLRSAACLCDLEVFDQAFEECRSMLEGIDEVERLRTDIQRLTRILNQSIEARNLTALTDAIQQCEDYGWPQQRLEHAYIARSEVKRFLAKLRTRNLELLRQAIAECESCGLPESDLSAAREELSHLEKLLEGLRRAIEEKDICRISEVIAAAKACQAWMANIVLLAHIL